MKCSKCGADNSEGAGRFCHECGTPLHAGHGKPGQTARKKLCDGCMGAFPEEQLAAIDGRDLCVLCQDRERRAQERVAPGGSYVPPHEEEPWGQEEPEFAGPGGLPPRAAHPSRANTSGLAIVSLVLGFLLPFLGFLAIIVGIVAIKRINARPQELEGKGLAIGGIIVGALGMVFSVCLAFAIIPPVLMGVSVARKAMEEQKAYQVLAQLRSAQSFYYNLYDSYGTLEELEAEGCLRPGTLGTQPKYTFTVELLDGGADFLLRATPQDLDVGGHLLGDSRGRTYYDAKKPATTRSMAFQNRTPGYNAKPRPVRKPVRRTYRST